MRKTILIYSADSKTTGRRFKKEVERVIPDALKKVCRTLEGFKRTLIENMAMYKIVVSLCATRTEMDFLSLMREPLSQCRLILIIPDHRPETIRQAHRLYPRFLSYADSNFENVAAVIQKSTTRHIIQAAIVGETSLADNLQKEGQQCGKSENFSC